MVTGRSLSVPSSPRLRFTLPGLMICTFGIAVGVAEWRRPLTSIGDAMLAALSAWAVVGLLGQIRDLWRRFHRDRDLTPEQNWGVRFALVWRAVVILLWIGCYAVRECEATGVLSLPEREGSFVDVGESLRIALACLLLLIVATPQAVKPSAKSSSLPNHLLQVFSLCAASAFALLVWWNSLFVTYLVHVACEGIAGLTPAHFAEGGVVPSLDNRYRPYIWLSASAVALAAINYICLSRLASHQYKYWRVAAMSVAISVPALYRLAIWLATVGLKRVSPFFFAACGASRWYEPLSTSSAAVSPRRHPCPRCAGFHSRLAWSTHPGPNHDCGVNGVRLRSLAHAVGYDSAAGAAINVPRAMWVLVGPGRVMHREESFPGSPGQQPITAEF